MGTLRSPRLEQVQQAAQELPPSVPTGEQVKSQNGLLLLLGMVCGVVLLVGALFAARAAGGRPSAPTPADAAVLAVSATPSMLPTPTPIPPTSTPAAPTPTPTPSCVSAAPYLKTIELQMQAAKWAEAASTAELALRRPNICAEDRVALTTSAVGSALEALFAEKVSYLDTTAQQHLVERYLSLKQRAKAAGGAFPSDIDIARRAHVVGHFLLAKTAFEEAYLSAEFSERDHGMLREYAGTLYQLGWWWAQGDGETREHGMRLLATSYALEKQEGIAPGWAWQELRKYFGGDERQWPQPMETPIFRQGSATS